MQTAKEAALAYLRRKTDQNINLLAALQGGLAKVVAAEARGCLLCTAGKVWQIAAEDTKTALRFYEMIPTEATMLELQETAQIEAVAERFQPRCIETYYNAWYAGETIVLPENDVEIRVMRLEDAELMARHYRLPGASVEDCAETAAYLRGRITCGAMFGAYQKDCLVGFAGTHDEGSIGLLTVLPAYRRRGMGTYLEQVAIARALEQKRIPFGQIAPANAASLALQRALGMTVAREQVCWMDK